MSLLCGLMIISRSIYWERLFIILYATKIVCFCPVPDELLFVAARLITKSLVIWIVLL